MSTTETSPTAPDAPRAPRAGRLLLIDGHSMAFRAYYALPTAGKAGSCQKRRPSPRWSDPAPPT